MRVSGKAPFRKSMLGFLSQKPAGVFSIRTVDGQNPALPIIRNIP